MKHCGGELSSAPNPHVGDNLIGIPDDDEACCSFSLLNNQSYSLPTLSPSLYPLTLSPARPTECCAVLYCVVTPGQPSPAQPSPAQPSSCYSPTPTHSNMVQSSRRLPLPPPPPNAATAATATARAKAGGRRHAALAHRRCPQLRERIAIAQFRGGQAGCARHG